MTTVSNEDDVMLSNVSTVPIDPRSEYNEVKKTSDEHLTNQAVIGRDFEDSEGIFRNKLENEDLINTNTESLSVNFTAQTLVDVSADRSNIGSSGVNPVSNDSDLLGLFDSPLFTSSFNDTLMADTGAYTDINMNSDLLISSTNSEAMAISSSCVDDTNRKDDDFQFLLGSDVSNSGETACSNEVPTHAKDYASDFMSMTWETTDKDNSSSTSKQLLDLTIQPTTNSLQHSMLSPDLQEAANMQPDANVCRDSYVNPLLAVEANLLDLGLKMTDEEIPSVDVLQKQLKQEELNSSEQLSKYEALVNAVTSNNFLVPISGNAGVEGAKEDKHFKTFAVSDTIGITHDETTNEINYPESADDSTTSSGKEDDFPAFTIKRDGNVNNKNVSNIDSDKLQCSFENNLISDAFSEISQNDVVICKDPVTTSELNSSIMTFSKNVTGTEPDAKGTSYEGQEPLKQDLDNETNLNAANVLDCPLQRLQRNNQYDYVKDEETRSAEMEQHASVLNDDAMFLEETISSRTGISASLLLPDKTNNTKIVSENTLGVFVDVFSSSAGSSHANGAEEKSDDSLLNLEEVNVLLQTDLSSLKSSEELENVNELSPCNAANSLKMQQNGKNLDCEKPEMSADLLSDSDNVELVNGEDNNTILEISHCSSFSANTLSDLRNENQSGHDPVLEKNQERTCGSDAVNTAELVDTETEMTFSTAPFPTLSPETHSDGNADFKNSHSDSDSTEKTTNNNLPIELFFDEETAAECTVVNTNESLDVETNFSAAPFSQCLDSEVVDSQLVEDTGLKKNNFIAIESQHQASITSSITSQTAVLSSDLTFSNPSSVDFSTTEVSSDLSTKQDLSFIPTGSNQSSESATSALRKELLCVDKNDDALLCTSDSSAENFEAVSSPDDVNLVLNSPVDSFHVRNITHDTDASKAVDVFSSFPITDNLLPMSPHNEHIPTLLGNFRNAALVDDVSINTSSNLAVSDAFSDLTENESIVTASVNAPVISNDDAAGTNQPICVDFEQSLTDTPKYGSSNNNPSSCSHDASYDDYKVGANLLGTSQSNSCHDVDDSSTSNQLLISVSTLTASDHDEDANLETILADTFSASNTRKDLSKLLQTYDVSPNNSNFSMHEFNVNTEMQPQDAPDIDASIATVTSNRNEIEHLNADALDTDVNTSNPFSNNDSTDALNDEKPKEESTLGTHDFSPNKVDDEVALHCKAPQNVTINDVETADKSLVIADNSWSGMLKCKIDNTDSTPEGDPFVTSENKPTTQSDLSLTESQQKVVISVDFSPEIQPDIDNLEAASACDGSDSDSEEGSLFDLDDMNISDLDSPNGENEPMAFDNISQVSLEFDENPFSAAPPVPPPRSRKKAAKEPESSPQLSKLAPSRSIIPTSVFISDEILSSEEIEYSNADKTSFGQNMYLSYEIIEELGTDGNDDESTLSFETGWNDIEHYKPRIDIMPPIPEDSEPEEEVLDDNSSQTSTTSSDAQSLLFTDEESEQSVDSQSEKSVDSQSEKSIDLQSEQTTGAPSQEHTEHITTSSVVLTSKTALKLVVNSRQVDDEIKSLVNVLLDTVSLFVNQNNTKICDFSETASIALPDDATSETSSHSEENKMIISSKVDFIAEDQQKMQDASDISYSNSSNDNSADSTPDAILNAINVNDQCTSAPVSESEDSVSEKCPSTTIENDEISQHSNSNNDSQSISNALPASILECATQEVTYAFPASVDSSSDFIEQLQPDLGANDAAASTTETRNSELAQHFSVDNVDSTNSIKDDDNSTILSIELQSDKDEKLRWGQNKSNTFLVGTQKSTATSSSEQHCSVNLMLTLVGKKELDVEPTQNAKSEENKAVVSSAKHVDDFENDGFNNASLEALRGKNYKYESDEEQNENVILPTEFQKQSTNFDHEDVQSSSGLSSVGDSESDAVVPRESFIELGQSADESSVILDDVTQKARDYELSCDTKLQMDENQSNFVALQGEETYEHGVSSENVAFLAMEIPKPAVDFQKNDADESVLDNLPVAAYQICNDNVKYGDELEHEKNVKHNFEQSENGAVLVIETYKQSARGQENGADDALLHDVTLDTVKFDNDNMETYVGLETKRNMEDGSELNETDAILAVETPRAGIDLLENDDTALLGNIAPSAVQIDNVDMDISVELGNERSMEDKLKLNEQDVIFAVEITQSDANSLGSNDDKSFSGDIDAHTVQFDEDDCKDKFVELENESNIEDKLEQGKTDAILAVETPQLGVDFTENAADESLSGDKSLGPVQHDNSNSKDRVWLETEESVDNKNKQPENDAILVHEIDKQNVEDDTDESLCDDNAFKNVQFGSDNKNIAVRLETERSVEDTSVINENVEILAMGTINPDINFQENVADQSLPGSNISNSVKFGNGDGKCRSVGWESVENIEDKFKQNEADETFALETPSPAVSSLQNDTNDAFHDDIALDAEQFGKGDDLNMSEGSESEENFEDQLELNQRRPIGSVETPNAGVIFMKSDTNNALLYDIAPHAVQVGNGDDTFLGSESEKYTENQSELNKTDALLVVETPKAGIDALENDDSSLLANIAPSTVQIDNVDMDISVELENERSMEDNEQDVILVVEITQSDANSRGSNDDKSFSGDIDAHTVQFDEDDCKDKFVELENESNIEDKWEQGKTDAILAVETPQLGVDFTENAADESLSGDKSLGPVQYDNSNSKDRVELETEESVDNKKEQPENDAIQSELNKTDAILAVETPLPVDSSLGNDTAEALLLDVVPDAIQKIEGDCKDELVVLDNEKDINHEFEQNKKGAIFAIETDQLTNNVQENDTPALIEHSIVEDFTALPQTEAFVEPHHTADDRNEGLLEQRRLNDNSSLSSDDLFPSEDRNTAAARKKKLSLDMLEIESSVSEDLLDDLPSKPRRERYDTIGSSSLLSDSEVDFLDEGASNAADIEDSSLDAFVSLDEQLNETPPDSRFRNKRRSIVPPSSLVLSVALDEVILPTTPTPDDLDDILEEENAESESEIYTNGHSPERPSKKSESADPPIMQPLQPPSVTKDISWETITINNAEYKIDGECIQPYKRVVSHGGFYKDQSTIIEIFGRYLPDSSIPNYSWVIDNLFLYLLSAIELLVQGNDYVVVFFNNSVSKNQLPSTGWMKKSHFQIPKFLRKNLNAFYIVQSSFYIKTLTNFTRMFLNRKVFKKVKHLKNHMELKQYIPIDFLFIPEDIVKKFQQSRNNHQNNQVKSKWSWW